MYYGGMWVAAAVKLNRILSQGRSRPYIPRQAVSSALLVLVAVVVVLGVVLWVILMGEAVISHSYL